MIKILLEKSYYFRFTFGGCNGLNSFVRKEQKVGSFKLFKEFRERD